MLLFLDLLIALWGVSSWTVALTGFRGFNDLNKLGSLGTFVPVLWLVARLFGTW
jgi:hypothetical protein